jgi:uncharacterized membrane protein YdjX (TVP38/TMEM64 family)
MNKWIKLGLVGLVLVGLLLCVKQLPVTEWIAQLEGLLKDMGNKAPALYFVVYIIACIALLPGSALTLLAGALWGVVFGTVMVSASSVAGATAAFLIGRYLARNKVEKQMKKFPKFKAVADSLGEGGLKLVTLIRLSPAFPFNLLNYMMGVTRVKLRDYVLGSWIGMFPGTVMYVYLGAAGKELAKASGAGGKSTQEWALLIVGLAATVAVTVVVTRKAKAVLNTLELDKSTNSIGA